ncbi:MULTISPECIES: ATP-grasp domain-containing protein [Nostocales]|uniref:ATP-grasp domain-containing protein n=3 Tax=Nostocales TaxID=1161 RepID=A0A0C1RMH9_9CYAN|nr:ATP-grasp domain-containing protein [Tolypothrix bouteillei]KAF3887850.1 ATP-grasp domain-containing protein [Tolypothrix bouteillei VB521301]
MIVLSESPEQLEPSASVSNIKVLTEAAQIVGCTVYSIPPDFERCSTAENALWHIPQYTQEMTGIWVGYIPELERYQAIYNAALYKGIKLVNSTLQHQTVTEFDLFYPYLKGLTPESLVIRSVEECAGTGELLGFPVFVKGAVQSRKKQGWKSCVANNLEELITLTEWLLKLKYGSRGKVIVRKFINLRYHRLAPNGFPMGREYRVFMYNGQVLEYGYYWDGKDDLSRLSQQEEKEVLSLATLASQRLNVPYIAIDIGQLENKEWVVVEVGDAQFSGTCHIPALELWNKLKNIDSQEKL